MSWIENPSKLLVGEFDLSRLDIDEAILNFTSTVATKLWLYSLTSACYSCPYTRVSEEPFDLGQRNITIDTTWSTKYRFRTEGTNARVTSTGNDEHAFCEFGETGFDEFGVYNIHMRYGLRTTPECTVTVAAEPVNIYLPLLIAVFIYVLLALAIYAVGISKKRWKGCRQPALNDSIETYDNGTPSLTTSSSVSRAPVAASLSSGSSPSEAQRQHNKQRIKSLDAFRGLCIVMMIFVNYGGGKYMFFEHAVWDGCTVADLVFPWFLWIMGVCVPVAVKSQVKRGTPRLKIFKAIVIRSMKLIGLGLLYNTLGGPVRFGDHANLRIPGVLQRFGLCYFVCSTLVLISMTVNFTKPEGKCGKIKGAIQDISILWISWIPILFILLLHFLLTFYLPVPECPTGYLGPGGLDLEMNPAIDSHCIGGASGFIDLQTFTTKHMYNHPTAKEIFQSGPYDPEGLLGTLTSIVQVWLGVQTGATMLVYPRPWSRLKRWGIWALITGVLGTILCQGKMTGGWIPLNKNLWSFSYVLVTSCFANILLSVMYLLIDIQKWWSGSPFFEPGMNSILLYMGHSILSSCLPWRWSDGEMRTHFIRLMENLWATSLWVAVGIWLHRKKLYWSV